MLIKLEQFVIKTTAPLSSACTFTSFGVHENVKLQPTTIGISTIWLQQRTNDLQAKKMWKTFCRNVFFTPK